MNALILYRSYYGNTRKVAEAIAERLKATGHNPIVQDVRQRLPELKAIDLVFDGAPTRIRRANRRSMVVLRRLKARGFGDRLVAIFDTCATLPADPKEQEEAKRWIIPGAAGLMHKAAQDARLNVYPDTLRCEVNGMKGPLVGGALEKAIAFADAVVAAAARGPRAPG